MDDLDYLLARANAFQDIAARGPIFYGGHEIPNDAEIHVSLKESPTYLAERFVDVTFGDASLAG